MSIQQLKAIRSQLDLVEGVMPDYSVGRGRGYKDDVTEVLANRGVVAAISVIDRLIEFVEGDD